MRERFGKNDEFERQGTGYKEVQRTIFVIGEKQPLEREQNREQDRHPNDSGRQTFQEIRLRSDRKGKEGRHQTKEQDNQNKIRAPPESEPQFPFRLRPKEAHQIISVGYRTA